MPKVFISYSQDSEAHSERVLALAQALRGHGFETELDQFHAHKVLHWPDWCRQQLQDADYVICICTAEYRNRADGNVPADVGKGAHWEVRLICNEFYDQKGNGRVVLILFDAEPESSVPRFMVNWTNCRIKGFELADSGYKLLCHILTGQPVVKPEAVGELVSFSGKQNNLDGDEKSGISESQSVSAYNPYDAWRTVNADHFFGRKSCLRELAQALDRGMSVSLVGDWLIGKSFLLNVWKGKVEAKGRIVRLLQGDQPETSSCAKLVATITGAKTVPDDPDGAADVLDEWLQQQTLPPLIMIDHADKPLIRLPYDLFVRMRHLIEYRRMLLVLASRRELQQVYKEIGKISPFTNQIELLSLGLLESSAVDQLIDVGAPVLTKEDGRLMRHWAGRHPYYLQLLGYKLWQCRQEGESTSEAINAFRYEAERRLEALWQTLNERERQQLLELKNGKTVNALSLNRRGLTDNGKAFGEILLAWMAESL